jgi:hypothetical protein
MCLALSTPALMAAFLYLLTPAAAFWRMPCRTRSGLARIDPLVSNGTVAQHVHAIHGSSGKCSQSEIDL